jgi:N-acetylglucosaminyl-diphospho-decaprenol L-rhamnosyltransferase
MEDAAQLTASVVSHGQMGLVNTLIADLMRHAGPQLKRVVVTLNVPEPEPVRAEGASFEVVALRNNSPLGFGANHNRAFRQCDTAWFAVLNPDLRLCADSLGLLLAMREAKDGLIAPLILNADGSPADAARRVPTPLRLARRRLGGSSHGPDPDFDWLAGMCLLVNSEAFGALGGFDERFHLYCEDTDLCLRMQLAGWRVRQVTSVQLVHDARRDSHRSMRYLAWHITSLARLWTSRVFWRYLLKRRELSPMRQSGLSPTHLASR